MILTALSEDSSVLVVDDAQVAQHHPAVRAHKEVSRLHIAVKQTAPVKLAERFCDRDERRKDSHRLADVLRRVRLERAASMVFDDHPPWRGRSAVREHFDEVGMCDRLHRSDLPSGTSLGLLAELYDCLGRMATQILVLQLVDQLHGRLSLDVGGSERGDPEGLSKRLKELSR